MFTFNIRNIVAGGKGGVKWEMGNAPKSASQDVIDSAKKSNNSTEVIKEKIKALSMVPENETPEDKNTREKLKSTLEEELKKIESESKKNQELLNKQALENTDFVRKFGNRVNLGAVVPFIEKQTGATTKDKIQAAFSKAKSNTARSDAGETVNIDSEYAMKSKLSEKGGNYLSEYNALTSLLESMVKSQAIFDNLRSQNIPEDKKVDLTKLSELFADFDEDGVIEAVNSVNDAGLWNKFKGIFTDLDGAQSDHLGEHQAIKKMGTDDALRNMLETAGIKQNEGEDLKVFAKRARAALLMSASISGTAELDPAKALNRMQKNEKYKEDRGNIEKQIADLQKNIADKNPNIKAEDANKIARSLASIVTTYTTSVGVGSANVDRIMQELGSAVTSPKGNATIIGIDMGVMAKVVNTERFKASLGAGIGGGISSEGIFAFAHIGVEGKLTILDKSTLEEIKKNEGNMTATLGLHAGMDLKSFNIVPALTLDALWNDKIDSLDNSLLKMNSILDKLTGVGKDGKITLDLEKLPGKLDPILRAQLYSLKYLIENGDPKMTNDQQAAHAILMRDRFMQSFKVFMASQPEFKGFSLAGIRFAVVPGAFLLGPVFQDISVERTAKIVQGEKRKVEKTERADYMKEFGLAWDSKTRTLSRDESNTTKITLTDNLAWDEKDAKVTFPEGKMPKFTIDTGVSNTLGGRGEKTIIVSTTESTTSKEAGTIDATAKKLESKESLPKEISEMIQALPINKLIERADVKRFMKAMTDGRVSDAILVVNGANTPRKIPGIPEFKAIIGKETDITKTTAILNEIDEKLVGDVVTRDFNEAKNKNNPKAFTKYKELLRSRGVNVSKLTQDNMTIGDIARVSFDKKGLRDQEINIIAKATGIDAMTLRLADKKMIQAISGSVKLETQESGYMSMARNRKSAQGSRSYETGSYIRKMDLALSAEDTIKAIQNGMGKVELVKVALMNLAGRKEFAEYENLIKNVDSSKVSINKDGKANIDLGDNKTLTIDLSKSKVSSALYGDTKMSTAEQAVCVNVAVLYEPRIAGTIVDEGRMVGAPEVDIIGSDTIMEGGVSANQLAPLVMVARKGGRQDPNKPNNPNDPTTKPGDGGEVIRPVTHQPVVNTGPINPVVTPPSVNTTPAEFL